MYILLYIIRVRDNKILRSVVIGVITTGLLDVFITSPMIEFVQVGIIPALGCCIGRRLLF